MGVWENMGRLKVGLQPVCSCGRGYMSAYDFKCGHCRSAKQQKMHEYLARTNPVYVQAARNIRNRWKAQSEQ